MMNKPFSSLKQPTNQMHSRFNWQKISHYSLERKWITLHGTIGLFFSHVKFSQVYDQFSWLSLRGNQICRCNWKLKKVQE